MTDQTSVNEILDDPRVQAIQDIFNHHDQNANQAQRVFHRYSSTFIVATTLSSLCAALFLFSNGSTETTEPNWLAGIFTSPGFRHVLLIVEVAALGAAAFASYIQENQKINSKWKHERQQAELCRIELFDTMFSVATTHDNERRIAMFDYFVDNQLETQLNYYLNYGARHHRRSVGFAVLGALVAGALAMTSIGGFSDLLLPIVALAGIVIPIFLTAINSWRDSSNDEEKAERYTEVWTTLRRLKGRSGLIRHDLSNRNFDTMTQFVDEVHNTLKTENQGWRPTKTE